MNEFYLGNWFFIDIKTEITNIWFLRHGDENKTKYKFMIQAELSSYEPFTSYEMWYYTNHHGWYFMEKYRKFDQVYSNPCIIIPTLIYSTKIIDNM